MQEQPPSRRQPYANLAGPVHYPVRGTNPCIRLFVDGALCNMLSWPYPKPELLKGTYTIGDAREAAHMSWCFAPAYLLATPLGTYLTCSSSSSLPHPHPPPQATISHD
ncbi:hypothetical protein K443DRAFT_492009 [Laccaria amethystina LaAM-08-1]|uniref:Uncharacterized protein n=1 Tax=Laccaria amethystina LaAM-08-1 TaxID=1095629 RepID=A0A0C9X157_9AGAR|nr:hypothetical protein K443DRAFT_492009 [Laccaria amethystina LaAM-08-1]